jgi:hypothetical protein
LFYPTATTDFIVKGHFMDAAIRTLVDVQIALALVAAEYPP